MKLYTKTGDDGTTGLFGGARVGKDDPRVEAYGCVDELNAALGLAAAEPSLARQRSVEHCRAIVRGLQSRLFDLGADLATPPGTAHEAKIRRVGAVEVAEVETLIDEVDGGNEPLSSFILPGGTTLAARLHLARTVCRRAERAVVRLARSGPVNEHAIVYLNRVGDLLFALARRANGAAGVPDVPWKPA